MGNLKMMTQYLVGVKLTFRLIPTGLPARGHFEKYGGAVMPQTDKCLVIALS